MDDSERRSGKRSRFDQTQPEPRKSRFDRRSRSPPSRRPEAQRERSPISRDGDRESSEGPKKPAVDPAAAAGMEPDTPPRALDLVGGIVRV